jgi:hypothetical protein
MTDCFDATQLAAYLEGTLDDLATERLERHAAACEPCAVRLEAATRLPPVPALARTIPPPEAVRRTVLDRVAARRGRRRLLRWSGVIAAGFVLVMIGSLAGPPTKEAATRPPLGPPLALEVCEPVEELREVHVTQAIGTLTVEAIEGITDVTWSGTRDDLTDVVISRVADTLALSVVPHDGASWPAEAHGTLVVPATMRVVVLGRGLVVRDRGGTAGISIRGRGEVQRVVRDR